MKTEEEIKEKLTNNPNCRTYIELAGYKLGDLFEYQNRLGQTCHYVISFLYKRLDSPVAVILFPDGYSECLGVECINKDKQIGNIEWWTIHDKYIDEASKYLQE